MSIKSIIVEDEEKGRIFLRNLLTRFCEGVEVIAEAANVAEAVELIKEHQPELVFLDIEMPEESGLHLFYYFEEVNFEVIFTTAYSQYAIKALRMAALDYLLKPIDLQELKLAIERFHQKKDNNSQDQQIQLLKTQLDTKFEKLALPVQDGLELVDIDQIIRIEANGSYSQFYLNQQSSMLVARTLREYDEVLNDHPDFIRVHRSHLINRQFVQKVIKAKSPILIMQDGEHINVSAAKKDLIFKTLLGQ
jgi:two-component system LytT family response regulator